MSLSYNSKAIGNISMKQPNTFSENSRFNKIAKQKFKAFIYQLKSFFSSSTLVIYCLSTSRKKRCTSCWVSLTRMRWISGSTRTAGSRQSPETCWSPIKTKTSRQKRSRRKLILNQWPESWHPVSKISYCAKQVILYMFTTWMNKCDMMLENDKKCLWIYVVDF